MGGYLEAEGKMRVEPATVKQAVREAVEDAVEKEEKKESTSMMDQIAGLLALMQNNKGMDLPGLLALCKEKGYNNSWGGEGMFMFVFLILFLFAGGGWGNLGGRNQQEFAQMAGRNLQDLIGLYDKLGQMQESTSNSFARQLQDMAAGFQTLDTKICTAIAETISAVRTQGDRVYDATRNVGDAVRDCCCTLQSRIAELGCKVDGLYGHTSVLQERTVNAIEKNACAIENRLAALEGRMELGFERTQCLINNTAQQQENARLNRRVAELESAANNRAIADQSMMAMQNWVAQNYLFTNRAAPAAGATSNQS